MYLKAKKTGDMVEVMDVASLIDPCVDQIKGRFHAGEEMQETQRFTKAGLTFPSGEVLPQCWMNRDYHKRVDI
ncbi:MAG: acetyltransferase [Gammaproteobacteria bacterium]|nr:acetyltransferase [Gammaproteobacteria bacterium]